MKNKTTEEILQHIYDSEIHLWFGWMWDGGVEYSFDPFRKYKSFGGNGITDIKEVIIEIAEEAAERYPESSFAKWYNN